MASAILVLVPFSFVLAMNANIILGRSMDIRDTDIIAAYDWLMSVCCWCEPPSEDTVDEDDGIAVATGATVLGSAAAASSSKPNSSDDKDHPGQGFPPQPPLSLLHRLVHVRHAGGPL